MAGSRIEQLIEDIYEYVENCKPKPFSQSQQVIVQKDELYDLLDELRLRTPDEIKRYQKIISNRDSILKAAEDKAQSIIQEAEQRAAAMISQQEIMQQAYYQADLIITNATNQAQETVGNANAEASQLTEGIMSYVNDVMTEIERILSSTYESTKAKSDGLLNQLKANLDLVTADHRQLCEQMPQQSSVPLPPDSSTFDDPGEEFELDEEKILQNIDFE